jgi:hypothetical protein
VSDDLLSRLDQRLSSSARRTPRQPAARVTDAPLVHDDAQDAPSTAAQRDSIGLMTIFLAVQFLWGALLFIPGAQAYRPVIRGLPYLTSVVMLGVYLPRVMKGRSPRGTVPLLAALGLIVTNLLHPASSFGSGLAQCLFQATIAAPMFWGWRAVRSAESFKRLLWIAFIFNTAGAVLGVLQVYSPERFMPPQFSTLGLRLNDMYVESLTYVGADGQVIVRPPGLSDQPGGAAVSGALTVVLGAAMSLAATTTVGQVASLAAVGVGLAAIYLTQVRSLLLMSIGALAVLALVLFRRGQMQLAARVGITTAALVIGSFLWARSLGGEAVEKRFVSITQDGALATYQSNRGGFVGETFGEMLDLYPFGAGVGRWGMMRVYFGTMDDPPPIYVEIQVTGWLLDGGIPMWILYGTALALAVFAAYSLCLKRLVPDVRDIALPVLMVEVLILGFSWAGPAFNTQLGILFWFMASALYGAARQSITARPTRLSA